MTTPNLSLAFNLPPERAVDYFQSKGLAITWGWRDMAAAAHARAHTVAGVTKLDVLQDIKEALTRALNEGRTYADFKRELIPLLQKKGWWGYLAQTDTETGEMAGKGLTPRRLETIFRTNLQSSYMAGRYQAQRADVDNRPWWMYVAIMDSRTRPQHASLNGRVFRYDDPFWQKFYPPNGYNCRCRVRAFTAAELEKRGIATSNSGKHLEQVDLPDPYRPGQTLPRWRFEYAPGKYISPDIGWEGNPGRDAELAGWAERKLAGADAAIAAQARKHLGLDAARDNTGVNVDEFIQSALQDRRNKQKPLPLADLPQSFVALAEALDRVSVAGKRLALDHDYTLHIIDLHGGEKELLRGQAPIKAADILYLAENIESISAIVPGSPPISNNGAPRISAQLLGAEWRYDVVFEVRRRFVVPYTLWKRKK